MLYTDPANRQPIRLVRAGAICHDRYHLSITCQNFDIQPRSSSSYASSAGDASAVAVLVDDARNAGSAATVGMVKTIATG
jgi:hypothetical protein